MGGAVPARRLESVTYFAAIGKRQALFGNRRAGDVAALLLPDAGLSDRLDVLLTVEILPMIELSLKDRTRQAVELYARR